MQRISPSTLRDFHDMAFDAVIDVRSPDEFAQDHIPGAINLPVLNNEERARVGTIYVQNSKFEARKLGAALISRNAATHLQGALADTKADAKLLVYCWRGGQRSGSMAMILDQIGWRVSLLEGGWRRWRRAVSHALYDAPWPTPLVVLDGNTGTAKTELLHRVAAAGGQVIDLEGLARHRGSLFGLAPGATQPSQKAFESALAGELSAMDLNRPVLIEAESNRIGALRLPPSLWTAMQAAPRLRIDAPLEARAEFLVRAYRDIIADPRALSERIAALGPFHSKATLAKWQDMALIGEYEDLARALMQEHYDPRYARTALRQDETVPEILTTPDLGGQALETLTQQIVEKLG